MASDENNDELVRTIASYLPDGDPRIVASQVAGEILGPIPSYSGRHGLPDEYSITPTTTLHAASYTLPWHGDKKDPHIVLVRRRDTNRDGEIQIGMPGGFLNPDYAGDARPEGSTPQNTPGEQPEVAARRELLEELMMPNEQLVKAVKEGTLPEDKAERQEFIKNNRSPVILPDVDRLKLAGSTIDYRRFVSPATYNETYSLRLTPQEFTAIQDYRQKLEADPDFLQAAKLASDGEINGIEVMKLSELLVKMQENKDVIEENHEAISKGDINAGSLGAFAHPHEMKMIEEFSAIRFTEQEKDYIDQFLTRAKEELSHRIPPPVGDDWEIGKFIDRYALDGMEKTESGEISVSFRIPSRQEAHVLANQLMAAPLHNSFPDQPEIRDYLQSAVHRMVDARFYPPGQLQGWEASREVNGKTVTFSAVKHEDFHLPDDVRHAQAEAKTPDAIIRINDFPFVINSDLRDLETYFAGAVILKEQFDKVQAEANDEMLLHSYIKLSDLQAGLGVNPPNLLLEASGNFLAVIKKNPEFAAATILHEKGHSVNRDHAYDDPEAIHVQAIEHFANLLPAPIIIYTGIDEKGADFTYKLPRTTMLIEQYQQNPQKTVNDFYAICGGNTAELLKIIEQIDTEYRNITERYQKAADYVESFPDFEKIDARDLLADPYKADSFSRHMHKLPEEVSVRSEDIVRSLDIQGVFTELANEYSAAKKESQIQQGTSTATLKDIWVVKEIDPQTKDALQEFHDRYPPPSANDAAIINEALEKLSADHAVLHDNNVTLDLALHHMLQAKEYRADFYAVEQGQAKELSDFLEKYSTKGDNYAHPSGDKRVKAIGEFTKAIAKQRGKTLQQKESGAQR